MLSKLDSDLGLTEQVAQALCDRRRKASCIHDAVSIVRQRAYGLALVTRT